MLKEGELPANVDPADPKLDDPEERARIVRVFERGLDRADRLRAAGAALERAGRDRGWVSERWQLRRGQLFLVPGDSPVGFRLPLARCPTCRRSTYPLSSCRPTRSRSAAAARSARSSRSAAHGTAAERADARQDASREQPTGERRRCAPRSRSSRATACSACSCRRSRRLEDYLELLAAVEATAARARPAGPYRRLSAAARSAPQRHQGHARSRRDRGQHPSRRELARGGRHHHGALRGGAACRGSAPTSS